MTYQVFLPSHSFVGWQLDNVADDARCEALVASLDRRGFVPTGREYPSDYRDNDRLVFDDPALAAWLFERTRDRLPAELTIDGELWILDCLNPRFRACRYTGGQAFCIHRDGPYTPSDDVRSHLTLQLYLDDDPGRAGGRTRFYADPRGEVEWAAIAPRRGSAIVFDHRAWHDGEAVTAGIKHVLRTDVIYRRVLRAPAPESDVLYRHRGYAWQVIACRDGSIASAGRDGTVRRVRRISANVAARLGAITGAMTGAASSPTSDATLDLGAGSVTRLVEARDGRIWCGTRSGRLFVLDGLAVTPVEAGLDLGAVLGLAARPDGGIVVSTSHGTVVAFERNGSHAWTSSHHDGWAWSVVPASSGYVSVGHDGTVVAVDDRGMPSIVATLDAPLRCVSADHSLVVGDVRGVVHVLGGETWRAHTAAVTDIRALDDGGIATSGEDGCIHLWRGRELVATRHCPDFVTSLAVAGGVLLASSYDGTITRSSAAARAYRSSSPQLPQYLAP